MATAPSHGLRQLSTGRCPWFHRLRSTASFAVSMSSSLKEEESEQTHLSQPSKPSSSRTSQSYFPKRGQTVELVCESLAFKGKGLCKVAETGFVVMCDRALPGERFIGRVTRRKGNYAEVTKLETISRHWDLVFAPCEYASYCGGCKTQNLSYEYQIKAKEQQVHEYGGSGRIYESPMAGLTSLSTSEGEVNSLMQQVADDYGLEVSVGMPQPASHALPTKETEKVDEDDLTRRLAELKA